MKTIRHILKKYIFNRYMNSVVFKVRSPSGKKWFVNNIYAGLNKCIVEKDENKLMNLVVLVFHDGEDSRYIEPLKVLVKEKWHKMHEDIVSIFEEIADDSCVDMLYKTALIEENHLEYHPCPLSVKCIYALNAIGSDKAGNAIIRLSKSKNLIISKAAKLYVAKMKK